MSKEERTNEVEIDGDWPADPDPRLLEFLSYWLRKSDADGNPPKKSDLNPAEIAHLMPGLLILERHSDLPGSPNSPRYRYLLVGTRHYDANNMELTGSFVDEVYSSPVIKEAYRTYEQILQSGRPHYWAKPNPLANSKLSDYERIIMPLRSDDGKPSLLIGFWLWH